MRPHTPRSLTTMLLVLPAALLLSMGPVAAQEASPSATPASTPPSADAECVEPEATQAPVTDEALSMPEDFRIELFDGVWEGIRDYYVDPETNGLDWEAIGDEYAQLVIATDNAHEVYELLREMVETLDDPYTNLLRARGSRLIRPPSTRPTAVSGRCSTRAPRAKTARGYASSTSSTVARPRSPASSRATASSASRGTRAPASWTSAVRPVPT